MRYLPKLFFSALIGLSFTQVGCKTTGNGSSARALLNPEPQVADGMPARPDSRRNPVRASLNTFRR